IHEQTSPRGHNCASYRALCPARDCANRSLRGKFFQIAQVLWPDSRRWWFFLPQLATKQPAIRGESLVDTRVRPKSLALGALQTPASLADLIRRALVRFAFPPCVSS